MDKLRLEMERLRVETFAPDAKTGGKGTVLGYDDSTCSAQPTCGIASRGEETYELEGPSRYVCCV
ncbi:MAG TPA: hypothetical protein VF092_27665 [Longimicrobium sp.]